MIDLHAHLLPGLDDGPPDLASALEMAAGMVEAGIEVVAATPHLRPALGWLNHRDVVTAALESFTEALQRAGTPLRVVPGAEHFFDEELIAQIEDGRATPLNLGRYILVELSTVALPPRLPERLFEIRRRGLEPLLAHVERYAALFEQPALLEELVEQGYTLQVDVGALAGAYGGAQRRNAWKAVERVPATLVASDAHNIGDVRELVVKVARKLRRRLGAERTEELLRHNPAAVLAGRPIDAAPRI